MSYYWKLICGSLILILWWQTTCGQGTPILRGDSWAQVQQQRGGVITIVWDEVAPYAYRDSTGRLVGIEVELLESFGRFVRKQYGYDLRLEWVNGGSFNKTYRYVQTSPNPGVFGLAYFSITPERLRQVQFTPAYMPDLNVLVTHPDAPTYASPGEFIHDLPTMTAYTMSNTTMAQDVDSLRRTFHPNLPVRTVTDDYAVLDRIRLDRHGFGYVPLSLYLYARQQGLTLKRQSVLLSERIGFAAIYPLKSDWNEPMDAYARALGAADITNEIVKRYLGTTLAGVVFDAPERPSRYAMELLSLQKELVTQRLISTALEVQTQKTQRSLAVLGLFLLVTVAVSLYVRTVNKQKINQQLAQQNTLIRQQRDEIERVSRQLKLKMLQAQLNPHFIFNSLNAIQYFIMLNEKRNSLAYVAAFSRFMRQLLTTASQPSVSVRQEVQLLDQYLTLEKMRFANKFDFSITTDTAPDSALSAVYIPTLFVHPFVENALYHGIMNRPNGGGMLQIQFGDDPSGVRVTLTDNGVQRSAMPVVNGRQTTTDLTPHWESVQERLALFNVQTNRPIRVETSALMTTNGTATGMQTILYLPVMTESN
ncbi:histidine kinase [Spirosoma fluviale]|uniref:Extracellular solute-binding protein, family 3 n=1 Tax=Spirosoma fluviale TaxID=1597977 RepID=A0A286GAE5_9BACT|nr:histidine kinase [Spirosoma fluviale]SOD92226.1 extracellular solute-binding protein, family 3 [Spirosoma fluviale]